MSSELARQLHSASKKQGSYTQSSLKPVPSLYDPYGKVGVGVRTADSASSPGLSSSSSATGKTRLVEKDFNLRTHYDRQTVTNSQGVSMEITPIKTVTFQDPNGGEVVLEYANAPLQKIVP